MSQNTMIRNPVLFYIFLALFAGACAQSKVTLKNTSRAETSPLSPVNSAERTPLHALHTGTDNLRIYVSFLVDETGQIVNPVVTQNTDSIIKQQAIQTLEEIRLAPGHLGIKPVPVEMTLPVSFRGQDNLPDLHDFLDQVPILIGSMKHLADNVQYPERARRASLEGRVTVAFIIDKYGNVRSPTVTRSLGAGCDEEVLRAIQNIRFAPGQLRGNPVNVITSLTFVFTLT